MLGLSGFGHRPKARSFGYKPRYYDPEAEAREERRRSIMGEDYKEGEYKPGMMIREGRMRRMQAQADKTHKQSRVTLIRTIVFVILVFGIIWLATHYFQQSLI